MVEEPITPKLSKHEKAEAENDDRLLFGFWVYLMTDLLMFSILFACYAVLHNNTAGGETGRELFSMPLALTETILLLTSSFTAGIGMYMLMSMIIRFVETPTSTGYGLGASVLVGSLVLLPLSAASYFSSRLATYLGRWLPPGKVLPLGLLSFITSLALFATERGHLWEVFVVMGLAGVGMGCSFAVMPRMIVSVVASSETGSALAMNQVLRTVGYSIGSALSAAILTAHTGASSRFPTDSGYTVGAVVAIALLALAAVVAVVLQAREPGSAPVPAPDGDDQELAINESVDSAIAGVIAFEPDKRRST